MSTRCQIGFYAKKEDKLQDFQALIYRHSDGYPGKADGSEAGVLPEIIPFLKWWKDDRGLNDCEYVSARLLQYLCNTHDECMLKFSSAKPNKKNLTGTLGHGICKNFHGDIEYFYKIYPDELQVYDVTDADNPEIWAIIKTIKL